MQPWFLSTLPVKYHPDLISEFTLESWGQPQGGPY